MQNVYTRFPFAHSFFIQKLILLLSLFHAVGATAQNSSTSLSGGTITTESVAQGFVWTNPSDVQAQNGAYATSNITGANRSTFFLDAQNWGFQTSNSAGANYIPPGATINGIEVDVRLRKSGVGNIRDRVISLLKNDVVAGQNKARSAYWPTTAATVKFGSNIDLWGTTWTAADLTNANFGVRIQARNQGSRAAQAEIDHVVVKVFFNQTFFYSKSTGNLEATATWGLTTDGSGSAPANFTSPGQVFFLTNRATATLTAPLTISGTDSRFVIGNNATATALTIPANFALTANVNIAALSSLNILNTVNPTLLSIGTGTTVNYGATANQSVQEANYHNLTLSGSGTKTILAGTMNMTVVNNVLNIGTGVTFNNSGSQVIVGGTSTGIVNNGIATGSGRFTYALLDASTSISGTGTFSNLDMDFTTTSTTRTLTLSGPITITDTLFAGEGTLANGTNLTMAPGSAVSVRAGVLSSTLASVGYDVIYNPFLAASPKTAGNELSGSLRNLLVRPGAGLAINLNRNIALSGNLTIASGTLDATTSNYNISIGGNLDNSGTLTPRSNTITFNGTANQTISGTAVQEMYNLSINNTGGTVTLNAPVTVSNTLSLSQGIVSTGTLNTLTLGASATAVSGGNANSYVNGPLSKIISTSSGSFNFPVGSMAYRPVGLQVNQVAATATTYTVQAFGGPPPARTLPAGLTGVSGVRYFNISSSNAANLTNASATLNYGEDDGVTDAPNLRIARSSGTDWVNAGGTGSAPLTGSITSTNSPVLGDFVLANVTGGTNTLPLNWISFKGVFSQGKVDLIWETEEEENTESFVVERSANGVNWDVIGSVSSRNTDNEGRNTYTYTDAQPLAVIGYYRIKSLDRDGKEWLSETIVMTNTMGNKELIIAPNPVEGNTFKCIITHQGILQQPEVQIQIADVFGRVLKEDNLKPLPELVLETGFLSPGKYILMVKAGEHKIVQHLMIR